MKASNTNQSLLHANKLRGILQYDPNTGVFLWRVAAKNKTRLIGQQAGCIKVDGYVVITINRIAYHAHRLAWLYVYGSWPSDQLDHIDRNRSNNRISNLRGANHSTNQANTLARTFKKYKELPKGVRYNATRKHKKYHAYIKINGANKFLGSFTNPKAAHAAYKKAAREHFGKFARLK